MTEFYGYERPDRSVGVRNHLLVIAPIDCSFEPARRITDQVENAVAVTQHHGCGVNEMVVNTLIGVGCNPNVAGVLLLGLGCETLTSEILADGIVKTGKPVQTVICQNEGGTLKSIEKGAHILKKMTQQTAETRREPFPLSKLTLAIECGGSDATSGLAANPATGIAADMLIDEGGTVIFSEPQEMTGTQNILAKRAVNEQIAEAIRRMIDHEEQRMKAMGIDSRFITKGNLDGGLTTIEEKSLGAIRKGGTRSIQGVLENNWSRLDKPSHGGLWLQDGTERDIPSVTHMVAAGAQVVAFTTGRGSTTGHAIAPVFKITGNSETYARMTDNMDINAGAVIDGSETLQVVGERIFNTIIEVASGKKTKTEALGYRDFAVFARDRIAEHLLGFC
jgi:altronate dehydratase large subunit